MRIHQSWNITDPKAKGASVALGNFDGVHLGHQHVIGLAKAEATRLGSRLGIITFEPHPRQHFAPAAAPFRLMNSEARANRLEKLGVDVLYELPFGPELTSMPPEVFARKVLAEGLGVGHVVVGTDFRFGTARAGDAKSLREFGAKMGFGVSVVDLLVHEGHEISSTAIRLALSEGRPRDAAEMLGHWHRIEGEVIHGEKRGRELGYPTANMSIEGLHPPKFGVYAVTVDVISGPHKGSYQGAASVGIRPMFGENVPNLETYLFNFSGDLYGAHLSVALVDYLRPEVKFDSLDALITQMQADCALAKERLDAL